MIELTPLRMGEYDKLVTKYFCLSYLNLLVFMANETSTPKQSPNSNAIATKLLFTPSYLVV
jgi:hypothetical protein